MKNPESIIEDHFVKRVRELGGFTRKYRSPANRGVPDRIMFFGGVAFIEFKTKTGKLSKLQELEIAKMHDQNVPTYVLDSKAAVDDFLVLWGAISNDKANVVS